MRKRYNILLVACLLLFVDTSAESLITISYDSFNNTKSTVSSSVDRSVYNYRDSMDYNETQGHSGLTLGYSYDYGLTLFEKMISTASQISLSYGSQDSTSSSYYQFKLSQYLNSIFYSSRKYGRLKIYAGPSFGRVFFVEDSEKVTGTLLELVLGIEYRYEQLSVFLSYARQSYDLKADYVHGTNFDVLNDQKIELSGNAFSFGIGYYF